MDIRQITDSEREKWNQFVAQDTTGDLLQSFEWGEIKRKSGGWLPIRLMVFREDQPVAAASVLEKKIPRLNLSFLYAPRGPVGNLDSDMVRAIALAARKCAKYHPMFLKVDPPADVNDAAVHRGLCSAGFHRVESEGGFGGVQPKCVMQLDLEKDAGALLADFKPKTRYNIRLAERKGVAIREADDKSDLRRFYDVLMETARRDRFLVRGYSYFETLWDVLVPAGLGRVFLGEYEGEVISGAFCFYLGDRCWYTYGASSNNHRNLMPNHLMQWRMILHAKSIGCRIYDFRGVSPRREPAPGDHLQGLNRFKEGFAAQYVEYLGEYDLPFSRPLYWLWTAAAPRAISLLKGRKRSSAQAEM